MPEPASHFRGARFFSSVRDLSQQDYLSRPRKLPGIEPCKVDSGGQIAPVEHHAMMVCPHF